MMVFRSCGRVMSEELLDPAGAVDAGGLVQRCRDLPHAGLVEQRVERDELPGDDEDDDVEDQVGVAQPVLATGPRCGRPELIAEVRVEQRLERDRDGRGGQQQRQEVQHREQGPVLLPAGGEHAEQQLIGVWISQVNTMILSSATARPGDRVGQHRASSC